MHIRTLQQSEWVEVASLIHSSTNQWYQENLNRGCFPDPDPLSCLIFPEIYEALDPGCCLITEIKGEIAGSCFYHPRETHVSLGIMNAAPKFAGQGVAKTLLDEVISRAEGKPVRLVSSALNLDSYSLYTRAGFTPRSLYQDMIFPEGKSLNYSHPVGIIREATLSDLNSLVRLEEELTGLKREKDFRYFIENESGIWSGSIIEIEGHITGFLFSVDHPGSRMLGPGLMREDNDALALISQQLKRFGSTTPLFLIPASEKKLISKLYAAGARNCELHTSQILGESALPKGIVMPTFMPETG